MDLLSNNEVSEVLTKLTQYLTDHQLVSDSVDHGALMQAMNSIAQQIAEKPSPTPPPRTVKASQFVSQTVKRFQQNEDQRQRKLNQLKKEQHIRELMQNRGSPRINKRSIDNTKSAPIYNRVKEIVAKKQKRLENLKQQVESEEEVKYKDCTFKPQIKSKLQRNIDHYSDGRLWLQKVHENVMSMKERQEKKLSKSICEKPKISQNSQRIAEKRSSTPLYERLCEHKPSTPQKQQVFKPTISPHSRQLVKSLKNQLVFHRLYEDAGSKQNSRRESRQQSPSSPKRNAKSPSSSRRKAKSPNRSKIPRSPNKLKSSGRPKSTNQPVIEQV